VQRRALGQRGGQQAVAVARPAPGEPLPFRGGEPGQPV